MISTVPPTAAPADATNETTDGPVTTAAPPAGPAGPPEDPVTTAAPTAAGPPAPFSNASGLFANRTNATLGDVLDALTEEEAQVRPESKTRKWEALKEDLECSATRSSRFHFRGPQFDLPGPAARCS